MGCPGSSLDHGQAAGASPGEGQAPGGQGHVGGHGEDTGALLAHGYMELQ